MVNNVRRVMAIVGVALVAACSSSGEAITEPIIPGADELGLLAIEDLQYEGAFGLSSATFGSSSTNYAVGRLAYKRGLATEQTVQPSVLPTVRLPELTRA